MSGQGISSELATLVKISYNRRLIERLEPKVNLHQFAIKKPIKSGDGNQVEFTGYRNAKPILSNSGELASTQVFLSSYKINATLIQRHNYSQVSSLLVDTAIDPRVKGAVDIISDQLAKTVEVYIRSQVVGLIGNANRSSAAGHTFNTTSANISTQGVYTTISSQRTHRFWSPFPILHNKTRLSSSGASIATMAGSAATVSQIRHAVSFLRARDVSPMDGDTDYVFYTHPWVADVLMQDPVWKNWNNNQNSKETMWKGEVGSIFGARVVTSNMASRFVYSAAPLTTASGAINFSFILGRGAYGVSEIGAAGQNQKGFEIIVKRSGDQSTNDPANLLNTVAGKMVMTAVVLNKSSAAIVATTDRVVTSGS